MKINYTIATFEGKCKRTFKYPQPKNVLKEHIEKLRSLKHNLSQITIMKPKCDGDKIEDYYNFTLKDEKIVECENYGYSEGQWLLSYETDKTFDYYIFIEDDYCPNIDNFEKISVEIYKRKFEDNIGLLCSLVQGSKNYNRKVYPIHFEGYVVVSKETMEKVYKRRNNKTREFLDKLNHKHDPRFTWERIKSKSPGGYYQLSFSHLFTLSGIEHRDYLDEFRYFPYWHDGDNSITFYKEKEEREKFRISMMEKCLVVPIQLSSQEYIYKYLKLKKIVFIIGMHRCGTSLLSNCFAENGFSIGKNKNKDKDSVNPRGYFENDSFTKNHTDLLSFNNSSWFDIRGKMKYTDNHVKDYRNLIENEFEDEKLILIKDPRLTFFKKFLDDVCKDFYEYNFIFCTRNIDECCKSLCFSQNISQEVSEKLYDISMKEIDNDYLIIDHKDLLYNHKKIIDQINSFCSIELKNTEKLIDIELHRFKLF